MLKPRMSAVGKRVAPLPPRRSRRALLTHRAPPSGRTSDGERFGRAHRPAHNRQPDRRSSPALCPDCGRLTAVPLGPGPSLHVLRRKLPSFVRSLLRYYGPVRLLTRVHVQRTALHLPEPARTEVRARMRPPRFRTKDVSTCMGSPTAQGPSHTGLFLVWDDVAFSSAERDRHLGIRPVSQLNTQPMVSPVNASRQPSRAAAHHSGPGRPARPYPVEDFHLLSFASLSWRTLPWVMCGRLPVGKVCFDGDASWSGAAMCSACLRDTTIAGPNAIRGSGPIHKRAL